MALAGLAFGTYNWIGYFKQSSSGPALKAVIPAETQTRKNEATSDFSSMVLPSAPDQPELPKESKPPRGKVQWPDTVGRNPFLTPREIELVARGEWVEEVVQAPEQANRMVALPEVKLTGLILDRATGNYRALIGGRAYNTGDILGLETIVEITEDAITLEYDSRPRTISLEKKKEGKKKSSGITLKKAP